MYYSGDLYGTSNDSFSIGVGGPAWKANGTTLEARATAGGALTNLYALHAEFRSTGEQLKVSYDSNHSMSFQVDANGQLFISPGTVTSTSSQLLGLSNTAGHVIFRIDNRDDYCVIKSTNTNSGILFSGNNLGLEDNHAIGNMNSGGSFYFLTSAHMKITNSGANQYVYFQDTKNVILGSATTVGTNGVFTLGINSGTAPTTSPADMVQLYSADRGATAGKAGWHIRSEDGTSHVFGDKVGIGTVTPYTSSFAEFLYTGTAASLTYATTITNAANAAAMTATGTGLIWRQYYYDAATPAPALSARIWVSTEGNWTSTASTQNAKIVISPALAGAFPVDRLTISSVGATAILSGSTSAVTSGLANASTTAFYAITGNTGLALSSAEVVDYHRIGVLGVSNTTTAGGYPAYGLVGIAKGGYTESVAGRFVADNYSAINTYAIKAQVRTTNAGTGYGVYLEASTTAGGTNWGFYQAGTENNYFAGKIGVGMTPTYNIDITGNLRCSTGFGCNGKTPQTAYASGGALAAYGTGAFGFDSATHASALHALVVSIRAALVADGIMS